jgi:alkylhydroperoxidase family enzyme
VSIAPQFSSAVAFPSAVTKHAPDAFAARDKLEAAAWASVDPVELELCRLRISAILGDAIGVARRTPAAIEAGLTEDRIALLDSWWASDAFSPREKARLTYTEQFVVSVSSMDDAIVDALLEFDDHVHVYEFTMAIYALELSTRVSLATRAVIGTGQPGLGTAQQKERS